MKKNSKKYLKYKHKLKNSIKIGSPLRFNYLIRKKYINKIKINFINKLLRLSSKYPNSQSIASILINRFNAEPNIQDINGNTCLHTSILTKNYNVFKVILTLTDIDVDIQNCDGNTVLHLLLKEDNINIHLVALLRNVYGANRHLLNKENEAPTNLKLESILDRYYQNLKRESQISYDKYIRLRKRVTEKQNKFKWREKLLNESEFYNESSYTFFSSFKNEINEKNTNKFVYTDPFNNHNTKKKIYNNYNKIGDDHSRSNNNIIADSKEYTYNEMQKFIDDDDRRWAQFWNLSPLPKSMLIEEIPWPSWTKENILWLHLEHTKEERKIILRKGLIRWHSDKFMSKIIPLIKDSMISKVKNRCNEIIQLINKVRSE